MSETQEEIQAQVEQGIEDYEDKEAHERSTEEINDKEEAKEVVENKREEVNESLDNARDKISNLKEKKVEVHEKLESGELSGEEAAEFSDRLNDIEDRLQKLSQKRAELVQKVNETEKTLARLEGGKEIEESGYVERLWKGKEHVVGEFESAEARQESFEAALELADDWETAEEEEDVIKIKIEDSKEQDQEIEPTIEVESEGLDGEEISSGNQEIIKTLESDDGSVQSEDIKQAVEESLRQTAGERRECREDIKILQKEISQKSEEISKSEKPKEKGLIKDLKKLSSALEKRERQLDMLTEYQKQQEEALSDAERQDQDLVGEALPSDGERITHEDESEEMQFRDFSQAKEVLMDFNTGGDSDDFKSALSRAERGFGDNEGDSPESTSDSDKDESEQAESSEADGSTEESESEEVDAEDEQGEEEGEPEEGDEDETEDGSAGAEGEESSQIEELKEQKGELENKLEEKESEIKETVGQVFEESFGVFTDNFELVDVGDFVAEGYSVDEAFSAIDGIEKDSYDDGSEVITALNNIENLVDEKEKIQSKLDEKNKQVERSESIAESEKEQESTSSDTELFSKSDTAESFNKIHEESPIIKPGSKQEESEYISEEVIEAENEELDELIDEIDELVEEISEYNLSDDRQFTSNFKEISKERLEEQKSMLENIRDVLNEFEQLKIEDGELETEGEASFQLEILKNKTTSENIITALRKKVEQKEGGSNTETEDIDEVEDNTEEGKEEHESADREGGSVSNSKPRYSRDRNYKEFKESSNSEITSTSEAREKTKDLIEEVNNILHKNSGEDIQETIGSINSVRDEITSSDKVNENQQLRPDDITDQQSILDALNKIENNLKRLSSEKKSDNKSSQDENYRPAAE
jgi:hypothetical protein